MHGDAQIYSSLTDDIRAAMQAAISRAHGKTNVPSQVGKGVPASESSSSSSSGGGPTSSSDASKRPTSPVDVSTIAAPVADSGNGSGVPVPLLVLGGLALLLAAAGGIGMLARRRSNRPSAP